MYDRNLAEVYDVIYGARKDYRSEAELITRLIRERVPGATRLLDVACGTGEHLRHFRGEFDSTGADISPRMIEAARWKLPGVALHVADMRALDLGESFDAVCCLFSAVGYLRDVGELNTAVRTMASHLRPPGVLIVEPWILPEDWRDGHLSHDLAETDDLKVARMARSATRGRTAVMDMHYLVGDAEGIRHFTNRHELTLFTRDEYESALALAGCEVEFLGGGLTGRGLLVGISAAAG